MRGATPHDWHSAGTEEPGDQQRDLHVGGLWAEVGPDGRPDYGAWSWGVMDFDQDNDEVASGFADSEDAAKRAVAEYEAAALRGEH